VVSLQKEILNFRQLEEESLGTSWDHFNELIITGPDLAIPNPILLQDFYMGLSKDSRESLDLASWGAFLYLSASEARSMLNNISEKTPCTSIQYELPGEEKESSPGQEEEVLIAKLESLQSQDLAINPKPSISQNLNPPREKESQPFEISCEDDLFDAYFENSLNFRFCKGPLSDYNSNPLKKGSLRKCPYSHIEHWEEFKDGMSSDAIEGESSPLEDTSILSPYMSTLEVLYPKLMPFE
jgi:hypothetical protein